MCKRTLDRSHDRVFCVETAYTDRHQGPLHVVPHMRSTPCPAIHMPPAPFFTVFTPTFNRADTISRTYESLVAQTTKDFQWLVVDDGSEDGTESLIRSWIKNAPFPIIYTWQPNRGKHAATNRGVAMAEGTLFVSIDSDDELTPDALALIRNEWERLSPQELRSLSGLAALCVGNDGRLVGDKFPASPMDCSLFEMRYVHKSHGERLRAYRVDVLKNFPYPEPDGAIYIPESYTWMDIDKTYSVRHINAVCRVYWTNWGGSRQISHSFNRRRGFLGHVL